MESHPTYEQLSIKLKIQKSPYAEFHSSVSG